MIRTQNLFAVLVLCLFAAAPAQDAGMRGGVSRVTIDRGRAEPDPDSIDRFIAVEGKVEIRVEPTEIRVVLALTSEGVTAQGCEDDNKRKSDALLTALRDVGIAADAMRVDFISVLPVYDWKIEKEGGRDIAVEHRVGYRLQSNLHVAVPSERQARAAVTEAFKLDITDVLAFDYWSKDLDRIKIQAQEKALAEAGRKSDLLLSVFAERPAPINVHEATWVHLPHDMYRAFQTAYAAGYQGSYRSNIPHISAFRPKNTYYHGFDERVDDGDPSLLMRPQISVVSSVILYFDSPRARRQDEGERKR